MKNWIESHQKAITCASIILMILIIGANVAYTITGGIHYMTRIAKLGEVSQMALLQEIERAANIYGIDIYRPGASKEKLSSFTRQIEGLPNWPVAYFEALAPIQSTGWYHDAETVSCLIILGWLVLASMNENETSRIKIS